MGVRLPFEALPGVPSGQNADIQRTFCLFRSTQLQRSISHTRYVSRVASARQLDRLPDHVWGPTAMRHIITADVTVKSPFPSQGPQNQVANLPIKTSCRSQLNASLPQDTERVFGSRNRHNAAI